jgi:hypothetical protein
MSPRDHPRPQPEQQDHFHSTEPSQGMTTAEHAVNLVVMVLLVALGLYFLFGRG